MIFGLIKSEGLVLCNKLKLDAKYGSKTAQSRREMRTFCEAFGITKIEAPFTKTKRVKKITGKRFKSSSKLSKVPHQSPSIKPSSQKGKPTRRSLLVLNVVHQVTKSFNVK